ncbi:serine/threonine-protein kinase [Rubricoccus marinus]|uniref:Protein kinase domain-containing protein n=1 Tax=Rubricoccus marinus TaxID=716817 RepID=A0A259TVF2_9BACT|nr:serine/threonine-protein kinase [Rubricoccus marinus]OZC01680.1 hypothetical protein BSZ36_00990 [Rubricoccus marinus]
MFNPGDIISERYHVEAELGRGGMGAVFRVTDATTGVDLALKCCLATEDQLLRRFAREVRAMQSISHRHVMPVIDADTEHAPPYFTMPLAVGSLMDEVTNGLSEDEALLAFQDVCKGIQALHNSGMTHRDIKPANAMRMGDGRVVVSDMGLVRIDPRETTTLTHTLDVLGTQLYMAPEQWQAGGSRSSDERTDVFQLGKTLYHIISGEYPALVDPGRLPVGLSYIVDRSIQNLPDRRYQSVGALMDAINNYQDSRNPDTNPLAAFQAALDEATALAAQGQYREENLDDLLAAVLRFRANSDDLISQFELLPDPILSAVSIRRPDRLREVLDAYTNALADVVSGYNYAHAELVGRKARIIFNSAKDPQTKAAALKPLLAAAVILHRFAALDMFDEMLTSVRTPDLALAVADMLREEMGYYSQIADRVPREKLDPAIRPVFDAAV